MAVSEFPAVFQLKLAPIGVLAVVLARMYRRRPRRRPQIQDLSLFIMFQLN